MQRIALALAAALIALTFATPSHATLNACSAGKKQCVAKKAAALLKCHSKNEKPPGLSPALFATCIQKAKDKFDGGTNPAKGCFAKLEAKFPGGCLTTGDTAALEAKVDAFVDDAVCALDAGSGTCPATPTPTPVAPTATPTPAGCGPNGNSCATNNQCCSLHCMFGVCQAPTCSDGIKNQNETGIDCGGGTCPLCGIGQGCNLASDCTSGVCMAGTCLAPSCSDGVKNQNETDIDCGGGTCSTCGSGKMCGAASDCTSGICSGGACN